MAKSKTRQASAAADQSEDRTEPADAAAPDAITSLRNDHREVERLFGQFKAEGAATDKDALTVAKAIAHSPLVKTAWAGCDPNWGRLMAAAGYSGATIDPERIGIWFGELEICRNGGRVPDFDEAAAHAYLKQREFTVRIDLGVGSGKCRFWTTDLTAEYVRINADYST